jgi:hypothetical protein
VPRGQFSTSVDSDVIPAPGVDRRPYCQAQAALAAAGDDLAGRALQILVPGMVRLAARWRWQLEGMTEAGWEVIARAGIYVARLDEFEIAGSVAGWLPRSVERDLIDDTRRTASELATDNHTGDPAPHSRLHRAPSAEEAALAGPVMWGALADATRRGVLAPARVVLLHAARHSMPDPVFLGNEVMNRQIRLTLITPSLRIMAREYFNEHEDELAEVFAKRPGSMGAHCAPCHRGGDRHHPVDRGQSLGRPRGHARRPR